MSTSARPENAEASPVTGSNPPPQQSPSEATGASQRKGHFRVGDKVQLTDAKGRHNTITLQSGGQFHTHRGQLPHDDIIGRDEGIIVRNSGGVEYLALRPLLGDYVLSMPRGAAIIYPKDAAAIVQMADVHPGSRVFEAGVGSGSLSMFLLRAVGDTGLLVSAERRPEFAQVAQRNVDTFFGASHPAWQLSVGEFAEIADTYSAHTFDAVVLDMLDPWENIAAVAQLLRPGGIFVGYVATTTQLSRLAEDLRAHGEFTEPIASESMVRTWHLEGLAVRPDHRMIGHTGFLLSTRRMTPGVNAPLRHRRPAKGAYDDEAWTPADIGETPISERRLRRKARD